MSRILITFAVPDGTGAHLMLAEYAGALAKQGHQVLLAHGDSVANANSLPEAGQRLLSRIADDGVDCVSLPGFRSRFSRDLIRRLEYLAREHDADVILGFQQLDRKYALSVARNLNLPCVITALNKHTFWGPKPVTWLKRLVYSRLLRRHASLVVCSSAQVDSEIKTSFQIPADRCCLIPNGLAFDAELLPGSARGEIRAKLDLPETARVLINIARIDLQKGQDLLLKALIEIADDLPEWRLLLVGDVSAGPNAGRMKKFHEQLLQLASHPSLRERVTFLGWRDDLRELLTAADVYVHPSRWEGWPLAVLKAMGEAKPIVMSDCVEAPTGFVEQRHGCTFQNEDLESLKTALKVILGSDDLQNMGGDCRQLAIENYDIEVLNRKFVDAVEHTIENHAAT